MADERERWCPICGNHTTLVIGDSKVWCTGKPGVVHRMVEMKPREKDERA